MKVALPNGCFALETEDGALYQDRARTDKSLFPGELGSAKYQRQRSVEVTDQKHLDLIAKNPYLGKPGYHVHGDGWDCRCGHGNWPWQEVCPRCRRERPALEEAHAN